MNPVTAALAPNRTPARTALVRDSSNGLTFDPDLCYASDSIIYNLITKNAPLRGGGLLVATKLATRWPAAAMNRANLSIAHLYFTSGEHENATHPIHQVGFCRLCTLTSFILALVAYKATSLSIFCGDSASLLRGRSQNHRYVQASMYPVRWDDPSCQLESIPFLTFVSIPHRCLNSLRAATPTSKWSVWRAFAHR